MVEHFSLNSHLVPFSLNRQDACSTTTTFSCGVGILPAQIRVIENSVTSQFKQTVANNNSPKKSVFTCDSTPSFRRNVTAYPNSPNDFAKFAPDSYFQQNASASKIEIEIENSLTIF